MDCGGERRHGQHRRGLSRGCCGGRRAGWRAALSLASLAGGRRRSAAVGRRTGGARARQRWRGEIGDLLRLGTLRSTRPDKPNSGRGICPVLDVDRKIRTARDRESRMFGNEQPGKKRIRNRKQGSSGRVGRRRLGRFFGQAGQRWTR